MNKKTAKAIVALVEDGDVSSALRLAQLQEKKAGSKAVRDMLGFVLDAMQRENEASWRIWGIRADKRNPSDMEYDFEVEVSDGRVSIEETDPVGYSSEGIDTRNVREVTNYFKKFRTLEWDRIN